MTNFEQRKQSYTVEDFIHEMQKLCDDGYCEWCVCWKTGPQNRICGKDCYKPITKRRKCRKALLTWANEEADDGE